MRVTLFILLAVLISKCAMSQMESMLVERYYVTDTLDATDTIGGDLNGNEVTYRVYLDLLPGSKLLSIYGDAEHPFEVSSTERFFNNVDGATFGYEIPKVSYESNTVALDSYLTLGKNGFQGLKSYFGVPKELDEDGSFIGGENNDGGSQLIEGGLLVNDDPTAGLPITQADGMDTLELNLTDWFNYGVTDFVSGLDSTIFGSIVPDTAFYSENFLLSNEGVYGVNQESNEVLIAQVTTAGQLSLRINAKILTSEGDTIFYVATNTLVLPNEVYAPFLTYPQVCGCMDPDYVEFSPEYACQQEGSCITPVRLGCMDTLACNFDPLSNVHLEWMCCYPGFCNERDIEEVCPQLKGNSFDISVYPNPASDQVNIRVLSGVTSNIKIQILNYAGVELYTDYVVEAPLNFNTIVDISDYTTGLYQIRVLGVSGLKTVLLVKL